MAFEEHKTLRPNLWRQCRCQIALSNHQYYRELGVDRDHFFMSEKIWKKIFFVGLITSLLMLSENKKSVLHRFFTQCRKWYCYFFFWYFNSVHSYLSVQQGTIVRATSPFWNLKSTYLKATILKLQPPFIWDWVINSSQFLKKTRPYWVSQSEDWFLVGNDWNLFLNLRQKVTTTLVVGMLLDVLNCCCSSSRSL